MVITGMGAITCLGNSVDEFWTGLKNGKSGIREISLVRPGGFPCRVSGEVRDFGRCECRLSRADRFEKAVDVTGQPGIAAHARSFFPPASQVDLKVSAAGKDHLPFGAVKGVPAVEAVNSAGRPAAIFVQQDFVVLVLIGDHHVVRVFAFPDEVDSAAMRSDAGRMRGDPQPKVGHVDVVDAVVADVAISVFAIPLPVLMEPVHVEGTIGGRSQPHVVIHSLRHGRIGDFLSMRVPLHVPGFGHFHFAEQS